MGLRTAFKNIGGVILAVVFTGWGLIDCITESASTPATTCADVAESWNAPAKVKVKARDMGVPDEAVQELLAKQALQEAKSYDWATCMTDRSFSCGPLSRSEAPLICERNDELHTNPFLD